MKKLSILFQIHTIALPLRAQLFQANNQICLVNFNSADIPFSDTQKANKAFGELSSSQTNIAPSFIISRIANTSP